MTYNENYGNLPDSTLRLIKQRNVSPADMDDIAYRFGITDSERFSQVQPRENWSEIDHFIKENSDSGYYRAPIGY